MRAGDVILSGDIARVIYSYEYAGRGSRGWVYAEAKLRERFPELPTNSVNAVMERARETVRVGQAYRQGLPGYAPQQSLIPDVRPLELGAVNPPPAPPSGPRPSYYYHEGVIEIRDPSAGGRIVGRVSVSIPNESILSKLDFERALSEQAAPYVNTFIDYGRLDPETSGLVYTTRIEGIYRGY